MKADLCYKDIDGVLVPFLWNCEKGKAPGDYFTATHPDNLKLIFSTYGYRTRLNKVMIVSSEAAAQALACLDAEEEAGFALITQLDDESWSVGVTLRNGEYDLIPAIWDLRESGDDIVLNFEDPLHGQYSVDGGCLIPNCMATNKASITLLAHEELLEENSPAADDSCAI